jgi:hypothetical protein
MALAHPVYVVRDLVKTYNGTSSLLAHAQRAVYRRSCDPMVSQHGLAGQMCGAPVRWRPSSFTWLYVTHNAGHTWQHQSPGAAAPAL